MNELIFEKDDLPRGWIKTTIGSIENLLIKMIDGDRGKNYPKKNEFFKIEKCLFLNTKNVPDIKFNFSNCYFINEEKDKILRQGKLQRGDIVMTTRGTIGNIAYYHDNISFEDIRINSGMIIFRIDKTMIDNYYLCYCMRSSFIQKQCKLLTSGSAQPQLPIRDIKKIKLLIPSLNEQKRIVSKIESIFTQIDAKQEEMKRLEIQLKSVPASINVLKSSILKQAFEGKLVPQDPNDESSESLLKKTHKNSKQELVFQKDGVPQGWIKIIINEICATKSGGTPSRKNSNYFGGVIPWIKSGELNDSIIYSSRETITELGLKESNAVIYPKNTILMAMYGATIGKLSILGFTASTNQAVCALFHNENILTNLYLFWFLKSIRNDLLDIGFGGAQKNISQEKIKHIQIPLPPLPEQKRIVQKIESIFDRIDSKITYVINRAISKIITITLPYHYA